MNELYNKEERYDEAVIGEMVGRYCACWAKIPIARAL